MITDSHLAMNGVVNLDGIQGTSDNTMLSKVWEKFSSWFTPPPAVTEDQARKAKLLMKVVLAMFITTFLALALALLEPQNNVSTTITFYSLSFMLELGFMLVLRNGKILLTGWAVTTFLWSVVAFATLFFGGLHSQVPAVFVVAIMLIGSLFGGRAAILLSILTICFLGMVAILEVNLLMPPQLAPAHSSLNAWTGLCIAFLLMAVLLHNSLTSIRDSEERYELAVRGSAAGLWDWNIPAQEVYYSDSFKEMLGYVPADFPYTFTSFNQAIHPEDLDLVKEAINGHLNSPQKKFDVEFRMLTKSGTYQWFHARGEAVRNKQGKACRMVGSIADITNRKEAEESVALKNEELLKINSELDQLVYSASHDLRAPISSLLGLIEVARMEDHALPIKGLLDMQERSLLKLEKVIFDIVCYSRNNRVEVAEEQICFKTIVDEIYDQLSHMRQIHRFNKIIEIDANLTFHTDRKRLTTILNNLISNAIVFGNHSRGDAFIKTIVTKSGNGVNIHVIDNGDGIDPKHLPRIFEMFYRGSEKSEGSGIGLYIVKEIVKKLQGTIEVRPTKNRGAEFVVYVPNMSM